MGDSDIAAEQRSLHIRLSLFYRSVHRLSHLHHSVLKDKTPQSIAFFHFYNKIMNCHYWEIIQSQITVEILQNTNTGMSMPLTLIMLRDMQEPKF